MKWPDDSWAAYLSVLLTVRALDVYWQLSETEACDYTVFKGALLDRYDLTKDDYRTIQEKKPEIIESARQFVVRLQNILAKW